MTPDLAKGTFGRTDSEGGGGLLGWATVAPAQVAWDRGELEGIWKLDLGHTRQEALASTPRALACV